MVGTGSTPGGELGRRVQRHQEQETSMKSTTIVSVLVALSLASGGFASGQGNSDHNDRDRGRDEQGQRGGPHDRHDQGRGYDEERQQERGAGPNHDFRRGQRLPVEYRHRQYVVDDWRGHHLSAPPRGYHWVQTGGDYVLVAIATGVILQLLLNN
jgi:Ni/Co efflux regulator RcnB